MCFFLSRSLVKALPRAPQVSLDFSNKYFRQVGEGASVLSPEAFATRVLYLRPGFAGTQLGREMGERDKEKAESE